MITLSPRTAGDDEGNLESRSQTALCPSVFADLSSVQSFSWALKKARIPRIPGHFIPAACLVESSQFRENSEKRSLAHWTRRQICLNSGRSRVSCAKIGSRPLQIAQTTAQHGSHLHMSDANSGNTTVHASYKISVDSITSCPSIIAKNRCIPKEITGNAGKINILSLGRKRWKIWPPRSEDSNHSSIIGQISTTFLTKVCIICWQIDSKTSGRNNHNTISLVSTAERWYILIIYTLISYRFVDQIINNFFQYLSSKLLVT